MAPRFNPVSGGLTYVEDGIGFIHMPEAVFCKKCQRLRPALCENANLSYSLGCTYKDIKVAEKRDPLLQEREKTHGSFEQNASISQAIKNIYHGYGKYPTENGVHCEALDMIALKLSRILSGQANFKDHWDDIAGYAKLASEACRK